MTTPRKIACALDTTVIAVVGAVERATGFFRYRSATARDACTYPRAVEDFAALVNGSLEADGLLRFARHTSSCASCKDLLVTLIVAFGLRRVIRAELQDLLRTRTPTRGQA